MSYFGGTWLFHVLKSYSSLKDELGAVTFDVLRRKEESPTSASGEEMFRGDCWRETLDGNLPGRGADPAFRYVTQIFKRIYYVINREVAVFTSFSKCESQIIYRVQIIYIV